MEPQVRFCTSVDGTRIAHTLVGSGRPLIRVDAWVASLELSQQHPDARTYTEGLAKGRSLASFDRRGVGASQRDVGDLSLEAHVTDLAAVADDLQLDTFDLFGLGDGSWVSVAYAAQHPDRVSRLVLWETSPRGTDYFKSAESRGLVELIRGNWSLARRAIADAIFPSGPTKDQRRFSSYLRESISPEVAARYLDFQTSVDVTTYLSLVKAPTLVIHRRGDRNLRIAAGRSAAALIEDARFLALEGDNAAPFAGDISHLETVHAFLDDRPVEMPGREAAEGAAFRTILFTDVEGSTALTERLGDKQARDLLREHERMVREALSAHGGSEVKTMGDGFMASFSSATKALECAMALQNAFAEHNESAGEPVKVRIGLNAGEPIAEDDPGGHGDLFGTAVNMAARIAAKAEGGEILASNVVRELVAGKNFLFNDRGETELRGFEDPVRLFEVRWRGDE